MNTLEAKEAAEKWVSDLLAEMAARHVSNISGVDPELLDIDLKHWLAQAEFVEKTDDNVLPNRQTTFKGPMMGGRPWGLVHEKELKYALAELRKCQKNWTDDQEKWIVRICKLKERKEAHDEFLKLRALHEVDEGWKYRTISKARTMARRKLLLGYHARATSAENNPPEASDNRADGKHEG
ncbi:hypothetical protein FQN52_005999 [Onygenales sp. PD_12]|nr:hypothetical protein FQN52_005999 [Onygenales sp. PD_12]KAK2797714.1 hypothetical protein FQN51_008293 [Onygenales sp. PD_10]